MSSQPQAQLQTEHQKQIVDNVMHNMSMTQCEPVELSWKKLNIIATVPDPEKKKAKKLCGAMPTTKKTIIQDSEGILRPGQFTAIMGPSGSGKTTLLNFLSGRLASPNLKIYGQLFINGTPISDIHKYAHKIAYVMQDDILLAHYTPREAFWFVANMRLPHLTHEQKHDKIESLIKEQILPTTGLDSSTAEQVIILLKHLAKVKGVNVISTIHQPSSEIFSNFERLILIVRGQIIYQDYMENSQKNNKNKYSEKQIENYIYKFSDCGQIIYQGMSGKALDYFEKQGFECPPFSNPSDHFMKIMNEEGLMIEKIQNGEELPPDEQINEEFDQRLNKMIENYNKSDQVAAIESKERHQIEKKQGATNANVFYQFWAILYRALKTEVRNPMSLKMKTIQDIIFAIVIIIIFNDLGDNGSQALQNREGVLFILILHQGFASFQGSLGSFSSERPLFLREKQSDTYSTGPYYWGRSLAELPFIFLYPILTISITYFSIGLSHDEGFQYPALILAAILTYYSGASYGFFISILVSNIELAMTLVPVVLVPLMVLAGFFVTGPSVPAYLRWIQYISYMKWGFQAAMHNEFHDQHDFICQWVDSSSSKYDTYFNDLSGTKYEGDFTYGDEVPRLCYPPEELTLTENYWESIGIQIALGTFIRLAALVCMYLIATPKRPKLYSPDKNNQDEINFAKNQSQKLAKSKHFEH
ncbi:P-loop containing nucleoside triphosphate hydrolase [Pseudocohnilembus persalinus]|uniref:p-loop containing nucleoside triphosphate hydrolase n=1 Tax=Pseudocohnilembus persalinus TaxID=266149 RepID=A0A0V0QEF5_PSEPJ|nr:P-loop containing nucleoside triphosphate hydrolase [Pseudocohnilembus persalinus]|eukprot:KRX00581.1 P-loop containing nucleoside triphosphate hydrolase [Pseudocohnilembus persalinus]